MALQESSLNNEDLAFTSIFDSAALLESAKDLAQSQLQGFAQSQDFNDRIGSAFGQGRDVDKLRDIWLTGKISFPAIEVRSKSELGGAYGAFSQETGKIYLAQELINTNSKALISSVLLEEYGHFVDTQVNVGDSAGDEGEIFSGIVQGKVFEPEQMQQLKSRNDNAFVSIDGQVIYIEQSSISDSGGQGGTNKTLQLDPLPAGQTNKGSVTVKYSYEHFNVPDQFTIRYEGKNIFDTGGLVSGSRSGSVTFERGNSDVVEVKVTAPEDGTAWEFSVSADDCAVTTPLNIEASGGDFKDNDGDGDCEFNGTVTIGRADGTAKLIRIDGGTVEYDSKEVRVTNGTVFSLIGSVLNPLFSGSFTIPFATSRSTSLTESGSSATDFKLGGLDVDFKSIFIDRNEIRFGAEFSLPEELTGNTVKVALLPDSVNALIIGNSGARLGASGKIEFLSPDSVKLLRLLEVQAQQFTIEYNSAAEELKIQGDIEIKPFTKSEDTKLKAEFTGNNFISIKDGKVDFKGSLSVEDIKFGNWGLKEAKLTFDTTSAPPLIGGSASITFPWGKAVPPRNAGAGLGLEFTVNPLQLNGISANVTLPSPGVPIGTTGLFLTDVGGSVKNFAPSNTNPIEFEGNIGLSGGPNILGVSLLQASLNVKITPNDLIGTGKVTLINDAIANGNVSSTLDWNKGFLTASGGYSILDGAITTNTKFKTDSGFNLNFSNSASLNVPKSIPVISGKPLASGNFAFDFSNNGNFGDDFAAGWGQFSIPIPILGTITKTLGFKGFFDGRLPELIGARNIPETSSFAIPVNTPFVILAADWETPNSNVKVRIKKPDGSLIDEAQFAANNIAIVPDFTDDNTRAVVIANPIPGIWDILVVDPTGLGAIDYTAISDSVVPNIQVTSPATEVTSNGIVNIGFNAVDSDSTAKIKLFYDDDNTGLDGLLITDSLLENDGVGTFSWNTEGVPTGEYFIYAMIMDDENIPVFSNYSAGKIKVTESADLELNKIVVGSDPITSSNFTYRLSVTNKGTSLSKGVVLQDSLPPEVTFVSASAAPSKQIGSDLTFNLGEVAPRETKTVDITVKAPATALTLLNTAEVTSKTFDSLIGNNFFNLSTTIDAPPTSIADLSVTANPVSANLKVGDRITYDFVVTNNGTANASSVVFRTNFTANAGGVQNLSANVGSINRDIITANLGSLTPGQSRTISVSANLTAAGTLTTTADISGNELDPFTLNNSLILQKNVEAIALAPADLELSLTSDKTTANIDDIVTLRLTLTNKGIGAATSIKVKQVLAAGLTFVSSNPQQGTYDSVSGIWDAGNIAKDNQAFIDIVTKVTSGGSLSNTAEIIAVAETDPDSTPNNNDPNEDDQASLTLNNALAIPSLTKIADDIFTISGGNAGKPKLQITISDFNLKSVNDFAVFTVDDAQGKINGIAPSEANYTQAALSRSKVVFSAIANLPNGFDSQSLSRLLEFNSGDNLRFLLIKNDTLDNVRKKNTSNPDILFSSASNQKVTDFGAGSFTLAWKDGSGNSTDFKNLVVNIQATDDPLPLGVNLQDQQEGEVIDLRSVDPTKTVQATFTVNREAAYNNFVGFYKISDAQGTIADLSTGIPLKPGDAGYAEAAIKNRIAGIDLQAANQSTATINGVFQGGSIFAPFIIANGSVNQLLDADKSNDPAVYFAYLGANSDGVDHIRLLGNNTFGFEDLAGGGDFDYNDIIIKANLSVV